MNKSYKVIYRESLGRYSVVSELVRACAGRTCSSRFISVGTLMAAFGAAILSASATAGATSYSGSVGTDGKVAIDLGVDIDGDHVPDTIEVSGVGLSVVEVVNSETGEKYYSLGTVEE